MRRTALYLTCLILLASSVLGQSGIAPVGGYLKNFVGDSLYLLLSDSAYWLTPTQWEVPILKIAGRDVWPSGAGTNGYQLTTDGAGVLSWDTPGGSVENDPTLTDDSLVEIGNNNGAAQIHFNSAGLTDGLLKWDQTASRFIFTDNLGSGYQSLHGLSGYFNSQIHINDDDAGDGTAYFSSAYTLKWANSADRFEFNNDLYVLDTIRAGDAIGIVDALIEQAELEILDGASVTTDELNYLSGVSSGLQAQLDLKAPLASPTFTGVVTIPYPMTYGATSVTAAGSELNILDGVTITTAQLNALAFVLADTASWTDHLTNDGSDHSFIDQSVISGASPVFSTLNMTEGADKNFVTDAEAVVIGNTSGTNTGDQVAGDFAHNSLAGINDGTDNEHITETQETQFGQAYTHISNNGSDHSFIDQSVVSGATPTFTGTNFSGIPIAGLTGGATGSIIRNNAGTWEAYAAGDNGHVLTLSGGAPIWSAAGAGGTSDSIGYNTDGGAVDGYLYPAFFFEGNGIDFAVNTDTITIAIDSASLLSTNEQDAGTDITADLEEEDHASEHASGGGDAVDHNTLLNYEADRHIDWTAASAGTIDPTNYADNNTQLDQETVEDYAGNLMDSSTGTHTRITVAYQDATGDVDFTVEDDLSLYDWGSVTDDDIPDAITVTGAVMDADFDAQTILRATTDDTPTALTVAEQTLVGRITSGDIAALTATQVRTLLNVEDGADDGDGVYQPIDDELTELAAISGTTGDIIYYTGGAWTDLAVGTNDQILTLVGGAPSWADAPSGGAVSPDDLTGDTSDDGYVDVAVGGTGVASLTDGGVLLGSGTGDVTVTARPTTGQILIGSAAGDPVLAIITQGEGIDITSGDGSIQIDGEFASTSNKGVASFDATDFSVSSGAVTIDDDGHEHTGASISALATTDITSGTFANSFIDEDLTIAGGTIGTSAITLVQSASPTPTAEGVIEWDTDNLLVIGNGGGQSIFYPGDWSAQGYLTTVDISANTNLGGTAPISISGDDVTISQAGAGADGYLSSTDWNTFNGKQAGDADLSTLASPTAWRMFYSNGSSVITELAHGAANAVLRAGAGGATSAPAFGALVDDDIPDDITIDRANAADTAYHVQVTDNESASETNTIVFVEDGGGTGHVGLESDGDLTYNPNLGALSAPVFSGNGASITALNMDNAGSGTLAVGRGGTGTTSLDDIAEGTGISVSNGTNTIIGGNATISVDMTDLDGDGLVVGTDLDVNPDWGLEIDSDAIQVDSTALRSRFMEVDGDTVGATDDVYDFSGADLDDVDTLFGTDHDAYTQILKARMGGTSGYYMPLVAADSGDIMYLGGPNGDSLVFDALANKMSVFSGDGTNWNGATKQFEVTEFVSLVDDTSEAPANALYNANLTMSGLAGDTLGFGFRDTTSGGDTLDAWLRVTPADSTWYFWDSDVRIGDGGLHTLWVSGNVSANSGDLIASNGNISAALGFVTSDSMEAEHGVFGQSLVVNGVDQNIVEYYFGIPDPNTYFDNDSTFCFEMELPYAITLDTIKVTCDADPTTEVDARILWDDTFIGRSGADTVDVITTTNGTFEATSFDDGDIAAGKAMWFQFHSDPDSDIKAIYVYVRGTRD